MHTDGLGSCDVIMTMQMRKSVLGHILKVATLGLVVSPAVAAQLGVPALPALPSVTLPLGAVVDTVGTQAGTTAQTALRLTQIRALLAANRTTLEADPSGAPILRSQIVAVAPSEAALAAARNAGYTIIDDQTLTGVDLRMVTLGVPAGLRSAAALRQLRALDPGGSYDFNHLYTQSGEVATAASATPVGAAVSADATTGSRIRVGLVDGGIETSHPAFASSKVMTWGCNGQLLPSAHGTAIASLLVGNAGSFHGIDSGATLLIADVYCGQPTGGSITAIASALAWLAQQQVPVINISLVGPANVLLEQLIQRLIANGHLIVAAVGNDGPAAPPLYPASYAGVVGVTAVDARNHVLLEAARGKQVSFAAPGADMAAAALLSSYAAVRGTSFAAPVVAGLLAQRIGDHPDAAEAQRAVQELAAQAVDLGSRGRDNTYGYGVVGESARIAPASILNIRQP